MLFQTLRFRQGMKGGSLVPMELRAETRSEVETNSASLLFGFWGVK